MPSDNKRPALGRGLAALLGDPSEDYEALDRIRGQRTLPVESLRPGAQQPRRHMDEDDLQDLARSIAEKGILQPLLVRRLAEEDGHYEIIAGERRWRAAQLAQVHEVPVIVRELDDREALEIALVENLQREDLTPLEEAEAFRRLMDEFAHTQEQLAQVLGKSRSHVANTLRLLGLPDPVKRLLDEGRLTAGHARALLSAADIEHAARQVVDNGLTVRQTEDLVAAGRSSRPPRPDAPAKDANTLALERDLSNLLGLRVEVRLRGSGGQLSLHFTSLDQLDDILHCLGPAARERRAADTATD